MKRSRIFLTALCALLVSVNGAQAQSKTTKKAKASKAAKASEKINNKAVADTVSLEDFSYDMGLVQTQGLKPYLAQRMDVDTTKMDDFVRGLKKAISDSKDKSFVAYVAGMQIGLQAVNQILPAMDKRITDKENSSYIDSKKCQEGFIAGITQKNVKTSPDEAMKVVQKQMKFYGDRLTESKYGKNREAGEKFLAENLKKDGVKTLPGSKVQYKVIKEGKGPMPKATDKVSVNYEGKLIDGTVFDSSYKRNKPAQFECDRVIKGWTEALTHMPVGSTWEIYIPHELAYGSQKMGDKIEPFSTLIFKVELLSIETPKAKK